MHGEKYTLVGDGTVAPVSSGQALVFSDVYVPSVTPGQLRTITIGSAQDVNNRVSSG